MRTRWLRVAVLLGVSVAGPARAGVYFPAEPTPWPLPTNPKHFFWAPGQPNTPSPSSLANDLIYHGGNTGAGAIGVETVPTTYLIFWGPDWANGFTTTDANGSAYTSQQLQTYVTSFLTNLAGTSWAAIQDEYCNNVPAGTTSCAAVGGGNYVTDPRKQLKGVWTDPTPVPSDIVTSGLAYTSLLTIKKRTGRRDIPLEHWAGRAIGEVSDGKVVSPVGDTPVLLVHWAGEWERARLSGGVIPHRDLWQYYRSLHQDE